MYYYYMFIKNKKNYKNYNLRFAPLEKQKLTNKCFHRFTIEQNNI